MRYVRIIKRTEADLLRGRGPSLQAARQGIAGARSGCESGPRADHGAWSSHSGEPARVTAILAPASAGRHGRLGRARTVVLRRRQGSARPRPLVGAGADLLRPAGPVRIAGMPGHLCGGRIRSPGLGLPGPWAAIPDLAGKLSSSASAMTARRSSPSPHSPGRRQRRLGRRGAGFGGTVFGKLAAVPAGGPAYPDPIAGPG
jgi:hypothetical protein